MRHLIFFFALALPLIGTAQRLHQNKELSQEERITLHVKKMQLALDLTEEQSKLLTEIFKKNHLFFNEGSFVLVAYKPFAELSFKEASFEIVNAVKSSIHNKVKK